MRIISVRNTYQESTEARFLTEAEAEPILGFRDRGRGRGRGQGRVCKIFDLFFKLLFFCIFFIYFLQPYFYNLIS